MTDFEELPGDVTEFDAGATADPEAMLAQISESQEALRRQMDELLAGLNKIAKNLHPLLTDQYRSTQERIRLLEVRIRNRQERPLINRMAELLAAVRRLQSGADIKAHVEEALVDALNSFGYHQTGAVGEPFDRDRHDAVAGSVGQTGVVSVVYQHGLASYGDVIRKARVEVAPVDPVGPEPDLAPAGHDPAVGWPEPGADNEQGGTQA